MTSALRHRAYRRLLAAQVVSLAGTGLATVALGLLAYDLAGARAGLVLGTVFAIKMVAYVALAPVVSALVHAWPARTVMVVADVVRVVAVLGLPFVSSIWQVYVLVFVLQAASAAHTPTYQAALPAVLPDERDYTQALSLSRLAEDLEMVLSPVLAALVLLLVPSSGLFFGTAAGFAVSAALVASSGVRGRAPDSSEPEQPFGVRLRRGTEVMLRTPALRPVLALNLAVAAGGAYALVQYVVLARSVFGAGDGTAAALLAALGAGSMVVALALPRVLDRLPERRVMVGGAATVAVATALVPVALAAPTPTWGLVGTGLLFCVVGAGWSAAETPVGRLIRRHTADRDLGAAFAAQFSLSHACWLLTYPLAGWLGGLGQTRASLVLAVLAAAATVATAALWPRARRSSPTAGAVHATTPS